jgi:xanthosine utilization system XapX-like protein
MTGPSRNELWFRLLFSLAGLALLVVAVMVRGISNAAALVEVVGIAGVFFGGTAIWTARRLWRNRD